MQKFDYMKVQSVQELSDLLSKETRSFSILSGGTDLLPQLREGRRLTSLVIDIKGIPEVNEISVNGQNEIFLGASVPCLQIASNDEVAKAVPGLIDSVSLIGGVQIQGRASLGGNLCNASPAADSIPALIVHNAICMISNPNGDREVLAEDFCTAPGETVLQKGEFLLGIKLPVPPKGFGAAYLRFIPRNEMDIAVVGSGSSVQLTPDKVISAARIAVGAVAPRPLLIKGADSPLLGKSVEDPEISFAIEESSQIVANSISPITDMRGSAEQRRHLAKVLTVRTLTKAVERAKNSLEMIN